MNPYEPTRSQAPMVAATIGYLRLNVWLICAALLLLLATYGFAVINTIGMTDELDDAYYVTTHEFHFHPVGLGLLLAVYFGIPNLWIAARRRTSL